MILDKFKLTDQVAIVTGGGRGIGRATCLAFAEAGADVVVAARRLETLEEVVAEVSKRGRRAIAVPTDVTDAAQLDTLLAKTLETFGRVDTIVNNAGGWPPTTAIAVDDSDMASALQFNVTSAFHLSRQAAPHLAKSPNGSIVNISSAMSHLVESGFVAYGTAKAALNHMTRLLAFEWAPRIRVNAIAAGATLTDALEAFVQMEDLHAKMIEMTPMKRLGHADEIAAAALYLASPAAAWVTGKIFEIDGGSVTATWPYKIPNGLE